MRVLFGGIGFTLPAETQQIERILHTFSNVILYQRSPHRFADGDSAMVLSYMLLLHNTSAHNPRLRMFVLSDGRQSMNLIVVLFSRDRMPLSVFLDSMMTVASCKFTKVELSAMYDSLLKTPFTPLSTSRLHIESIFQLTIASFRVQSGNQTATHIHGWSRFAPL